MGVVVSERCILGEREAESKRAEPISHRRHLGSFSVDQPLWIICAGSQRRVVVFKPAEDMTGGSDFHKSYNNNKDSEPRMDVDMDSSHMESERGDLDSSIPAACSSNGSGGEEDEAEAVGRLREAGGSSSHHTPDGGGVYCGGREQEVSVEIGETYLCQRADKSWRECWFCSAFSPQLQLMLAGKC